MPSSSDQTPVGRTLTLGGGAESSLEGRDIELSVSPKDIRTSPCDLCASRTSVAADLPGRRSVPGAQTRDSRATPGRPARFGGLRPPRGFVVMDRIAIGLGSVFMHLKAELN